MNIGNPLPVRKIAAIIKYMEMQPIPACIWSDMTDGEIRTRLGEMTPATLYDVFYESGTILSGMLIDLERRCLQVGETASATKARMENLELLDERESVSPDDSERQIECDIAWSRRIKELETELGTMESTR